MTIPVQRPCLGPEELQAVQRVFESRWLGLGAITQEFERELQTFLGVRHVIAVSSGTAALHVALDVLDLKPGDEVLVPTLTFVATTQAIVQAGATPVFCDVEESTFNLDVRDAAARVTPRTRAIVPVHFGGTACNMDAIHRLAADARLKVVEDAAHAFGSTYGGRKIGTLSDLTCFSFDPIKNITCGEGGAVATNDQELADRIAPRRVLGITRDTWSRLQAAKPWSYDVAGPGYRYHMSNINAAIGLEQLKRFDAFRRRRQAIARRYDEAFASMPGLIRRDQRLDETCPFFYVVRIPDERRDALMDHLKADGIATGVHYIPNHLHQAFAHGRTTLATAERLGREILTLPLFYEMTDEQLEHVVGSVHRFFRPASSAVREVASGRRLGDGAMRPSTAVSEGT
jgi:perosamine synthetase